MIKALNYLGYYFQFENGGTNTNRNEMDPR